MKPDLTRPSRLGLTLIEVMIAIAILAIAFSIVFPFFADRPQSASVASEATLIEQAKGLAIARAEPMRLTVDRQGGWEIVSDAAPGAGRLARGTLPEAPGSAWSLRVTELGVCLPGDAAAQARGPAIDAVSCSLRP